MSKFSQLVANALQAIYEVKQEIDRLDKDEIADLQNAASEILPKKPAPVADKKPVLSAVASKAKRKSL